jgi:alpha-ketoglutarate-dependent taurine dioxygenase
VTVLPQTSALVIRPVAGHIGADISGVDLAEPLPPEIIGQLRDALHEFKVIFFRGQRLDHASHVAFGRQFGTLTYAHPLDEAPPEGYAEIFTLDTKRYEESFAARPPLSRQRHHSYFSGWHTDVSPAVNPPAMSILRAEVVPDMGGDTQWTNLQSAYEGLSPAVAALADTLRAEHRYGGQDGRRTLDTGTLGKRIADNPLTAIHPVVRVHPVTGKKCLFVNPGYTSHIVDVTPRESSAILDLLYAEITLTEYTVRFRWEPGSVAIWDNRATSHRAPTDIEHLGQRRTMHRVTVMGDIPVGPDGRESELVAGKPFTDGDALIVRD